MTVRLTSGEIDAWTALALASGQRTSSQAARIYRLRREYRKACRLAGIAPDRRLLYSVPESDEYGTDEQARLNDSICDILDAVRAAIRCDDEDEDEDFDEDEEDDTELGVIICGVL